MTAAFARATLTASALIAATLAAAPAPSPSPAPSPAPAAASPAAPDASASAAPGAPSFATMDAPGYRLETDTIVSERNGDFTMPHRVAFSRPGSSGVADSAKGNSKRGTVTLTGNVVLRDNGNAPEGSNADDYARSGLATLSSDALDVDSAAKFYVATGHVHFVQGQRGAVADKGTLDRAGGTLRLEGHVKINDGDSTLSAQTMDYNLNSKFFDARGKPVVIQQPVPVAAPGTPTPKPKKRRLPF